MGTCVAKLRELFEYHTDGYLVNKVTRCKRNAKKGDRVGRGSPVGYRQVKVLGKMWREHEIVWIVCKGEMPDVIDHINHDIHDNRIENLRSVTHKENIRHGSGRQAGISVDKRTGKFVASIYVDCTKNHIGCYGKLEDALAARKEAEVRLWATA